MIAILAWAAQVALGGLAGQEAVPAPERAAERRALYVAAPGIRDYLQYGGAGILVFDIDRGHAWVKRLASPFPNLSSDPEKPRYENIKGITACAATGRLYVSTITQLASVDLGTEKALWIRKLEGGCDRMAMTPDGGLLYVPSFEGPHWNVVRGDTGEEVGRITLGSGAHNTCMSLDGKRVFLAGLKSPVLSIADTASHKVVGTIPFSAPVRPFTVNGAATLAYVTVNGLLGFEIGDVREGKFLWRVEVPGFLPGPVKRHGCPSHGVGLTPDEKEVWVVDGHNEHVHIFDNTVMPPRPVAHIKLSDEPGWVTFSLDGRFAYPSTGEVIDTRTRKIVAELVDEKRSRVMSEKMVEIDFQGGAPRRQGDQFGVGRVTP
jgi:hypothetical protein